MCFNCGCGIPTDKMGHDENIAEETIEKAAKAEGQTVEDAKKNMLQMLKKQLGKKDNVQ